MAPSIGVLTQDEFLDALTVATQRCEVRKMMNDQSDQKSKEASPGPLVSETKWPEWQPKFDNYLSIILGVEGIPLSYVTRDNELPDRTGPFADFIDETISCAPLTGVAWEADRATVHQALVSFTSGQPSEDWIKPVARYKDDRRSDKALKDHFACEGNATRRIAEADRLKDSLHYKNERSMTFELFLTKYQKMYNIYRDEGEELSEDAKVRFLFKKISHSGLNNAVEAMKARITTSTTTISYTTVANHLFTAVFELPEYVAKNCNISKGCSPLFFYF